MSTHLPVLLSEVLSLFEPCSLFRFLDGTVGGGGHAEAIIRSHPEMQFFLGVDRDASALKSAAQRLSPLSPQMRFLHSRFSQINREGKGEVGEFTGILLDVGVSSMQLDGPDRGMSFRYEEAPLDMRMDREEELTAEEILNRWSEKDLGRIFREYGEERAWRRAAQEIVRARRKRALRTTGDLCRVLLAHIRGKSAHRHPLTQIFQALRIAVNGELDELRETLGLAIDLLCPGGRLLVITFHGLEERSVKEVVREHLREKSIAWLVKRPLLSSEEEQRKNPRSRCAKLRAIEKLR